MAVKYIEFKSQFENGQNYPVYLFEGEDAFFRQRGLDLVKAKYLSEPDLNLTNYESALENAYKFFGCALGLWVIYEIDARFIRFETKAATWWAQMLKLVAGFCLLLLILEGSKPLLHLIFRGSPVAHTIRYFCTVLFAGAVWPLTFKWFARLGVKSGSPSQES